LVRGRRAGGDRTAIIRLLGFSKNVETPANAALYATGNNLAIAGDLVRRTLLCSLDAQCERPELRTFETDVIETIRATRGQLVTAALTVLRAWLGSGERMQVSPFGSFDHWSRRIREALLWLGQDDPCNTATKVRAADPTREALLAVVAQWSQHLGIQSAYTVQEVINRATVDNDFHISLLNVAAAKGGGNVVSNKRLGWGLKNVEGKIVHLVDKQNTSELVLKKEGIVAGYSTSRLHDAMELRKS
jgi:putative DNA primase/helicase